MRRPGHRLPLLFGLIASAAALAWAPAAEARTPFSTCATFHANTLGSNQAWRGYKQGRVTCGATTAVLDAVLHGRGEVHQGSDSLDSYILFHGWKCGLEQMGLQFCSRHGSADAVIVALDCDIMSGCPARYPSDDPT